MENKEATGTSQVRSGPKVSVCVITYNQVNYIGQCLQSIVDQETDFDFEVIVGDDCSTDGTQEIVLDFVTRYPELVRAIFQKANTGGAKNFIDVHEAAQGTYIAHMDGDDYALPCKLQLQADFLDRHPSCNLVWHRVAKLVEGMPVKFPTTHTLFAPLFFKKRDCFAIGSIGYHSSKMYRASLRDICHANVKYGYDYELDIHLVGEGKAAILGEVLGVYRVGRGLSSVADSRARRLLDSVLIDGFTRETKYRGRISSALLLLAIADAKNRRSYWGRSLRNYLNCFRFSSIYFLFRYIPIRYFLRRWQR